MVSGVCAFFLVVFLPVFFSYIFCVCVVCAFVWGVLRDDVWVVVVVVVCFV